MVALICSWHAHHAATLRAVEARVRTGATIAISAAALVETFSVLTRLPSPHRLAPADAFELLRANFRDLDQCETVGLGERDYWSLLESAPRDGVAGGRTHDAVIAAAARKGRAAELLTLNAKHFDSFGDESLRIISPVR